MRLSIITINYNNAAGLRKTLDSVQVQTGLQSGDFEHIIIDGGSADCSVEIISAYASKATYPVKWVSEKDNGIYNAINKGILMASGDYIQVLNSGDMLSAPDVTRRMLDTLDIIHHTSGDMPAIMYGNMIKVMPDGKMVRDNCGGQDAPLSFLYFYTGTLNHDCAYIRRELFSKDKIGLYDEQMKICSDWKWYVDAIALHGVRPEYVDIDVTVFDMNGISESNGKNKALIQKERRDYLEQILPASILRDYDMYALDIAQMNRLRKHHLYGLVRFMERVLFKLEKWGILRK